MDGKRYTMKTVIKRELEWLCYKYYTNNTIKIVTRHKGHFIKLKS